MNQWILPLPPNRIRRSYRGGKMLEKFEAKATCVDSNRPEDWIASMVDAKNPGLPHVEYEGLSTIINDDGDPILLRKLIEDNPAYFLGEQYVNDHGTSPTFLLKLLDSATRLNVQVHPTRKFAREFLDSPFGKLECYSILAVRPGVKPSIRMGFQHPPSREEFKRVVMEQDIAAMDAWFDPVPVKPGETWLIPGGIPHAIGEGLLLVEIQEPSDLTARFEFERAGIVVPPEARFLGRDIDFTMDMLDFSGLSTIDARTRYNLTPRIVRDDKSCTEEILVDEDRVDCFRMKKVKAAAKMTLVKDPQLLTGIVIQGKGKIEVAGEILAVDKGTKFLVPAAAEKLTIIPSKVDPMIFLACFPGIK